MSKKVETYAENESFFDGGLLQKIGWTLLGALVTGITLGICYPWAVCMLQRWEVKHTVINGKRLAFDGRAIQLFGNWMKWWFFSIITIGIYALWVPIKMKKWVVKHTHFAEPIAAPVAAAPVAEPTPVVTEAPVQAD